jgi:hypothetical protein
MATNQIDLESIIATMKAQAPHSDASLSGPTFQVSQGPQPEKRGVAGQTPHSGEVAFRVGVEGRRATAGLLADPYASRLVYLDKPFLIWKPAQGGSAAQLIDSQIVPSNSWARIKLYVEGSGGLSYSTTLGFYYLWTNESPNPVVINIDTTVVITGSCFVQSGGRFFGGKTSTVEANAFLQPQRWFGWGTDPATGTSLDQTYLGILQQSQQAAVVKLEAWGQWGLFAGATSVSRSFSYAPFDLTMKSLLVPGGASLVFNVGMYFNGETKGDTLQDQALIDFSTQGAVFSPNVVLTLLTPA